MAEDISILNQREAENKAYQIELQNSRPDIVAQFLSNAPASEFKNITTGEAYQIASNVGTDFSIKNKEDYWNVKGFRDQFEDRAGFDDFYKKMDETKVLLDAVGWDARDIMVPETPRNQNDPHKFFENEALNSVRIASFSEGAYAKNDNVEVGITGSRERAVTTKKLAQLVGVKTEDGFMKSPDMSDQIFTTDIFRVARDEDGMPKFNLVGDNYIERMDGKTEVTSRDNLVNVFSSGIAEDTWFDNNVIKQDGWKMVMQQVPKFAPYARVIPFAMDAISGLAEIAKTTADLITQDGSKAQESGFKDSMNYLQNYLKRFNADVDEQSSESLWNFNNIVKSVGDIGPQIMGMGAIAKFPATIMGLKSSKAAGFEGLKALKSALDVYKTEGGFMNAGRVVGKAFKYVDTAGDEFYAADKISQSSKALVQKIGSFIGRGSMSLISTEDFAQEAKESGLSPNEAMLMHVGYTTFMHMGPSRLTERLTANVEDKFSREVNKNLFKIFVPKFTGVTTKATENEMIGRGIRMGQAYTKAMGTISKLYQSSREAGVAGYLGSMLNEGSEEMAENAGEYGLRWMFNTVNSDRKATIGRFKDINWGEFAENTMFSGAMGAIGGGVGKVFTGSAKQKSVELTDDNFFNYLAQTSLNGTKRAALDKDLADAKPGTFGDASLSYAKDKDGNFKRVDLNSVDPLLNQSQDDVARAGFRTAWQLAKATSDKRLEIAKASAEEKDINFAKEWDTTTEKEFGADLGLRLEDANKDMAAHVTSIIRNENDIAGLELKHKTAETSIEKKSISDEIELKKKKIEESDERIREIVHGEVANKHFEKAAYELFSGANTAHMKYEEWSALRKAVLKEAKTIQKDHTKNTALSSKFLGEALDILNTEGTKAFAEKLKTAPELTREDRVKLNKAIEGVTEEKVGKNSPLYNTIIAAATKYGLEDWQMESLMDSLGDDSIVSLESTLHNYGLVDTQDVFTPDLDQHINNINDTFAASHGLKEYLSDFDSEFDQKSAQKVTEDLLQISGSKELFDAVFKASEAGKIYLSPELRKHIFNTITDTADYDKEKDKGHSKQSILNFLSGKIQEISMVDTRSQAIYQAMNRDFGAGDKSFSYQVKEQLDSFNSGDASMYVAPVDNKLGMLDSNLLRRFTFTQGLLNVDMLTSKFQSINKDKFKFKENIETILSPEALTKYIKYLSPEGSEEDRKKAYAEFLEDVNPLLQVLNKFKDSMAADRATLAFLQGQADANKSTTIEGIVLSDMQHVQTDIENFNEILVRVLKPGSIDHVEKYAEIFAILVEATRKGTEVSNNYKVKRELLKKAELAFNSYFLSLPTLVKEAMRTSFTIAANTDIKDVETGVNVIRKESQRQLYNYFLMLSRDSFGNIHQRYEAAIATLPDLKSSPSYEQERAIIQMSVKFREKTPLTVTGKGTKANRLVLDSSNAWEALENVGFVQGISGSGKTTYIAAIIKMMNDDPKSTALLATVKMPQYEKLTKTLSGLNINLEKPVTKIDGHYDITTLIKDLNGLGNPINPGIIIIDEITQLSHAQLKELTEAVDAFNSTGKKVFVLGLGDPLQIGHTKKVDAGYNFENISSLSMVEKTALIQTSQRNGYTDNSELFRSLRMMMMDGTYRLRPGETRFDPKNPGQLLLNHGKEGKSDVGVQVYGQPDRAEWEKMVLERIKRAVDNGEEIKYITDKPVADYQFLIDAKLIQHVIEPIDAQGNEYPQVIVDLAGFNIHTTDPSKTKAAAQVLYTSVTRAMKGILIHDTGNWNVKTSPVPSTGRIGRVESKLDEKAFQEFKALSKELTSAFVALEKSMGNIAPTAPTSGAVTKEVLTDNRMLDAFIVDSFEVYKKVNKDIRKTDYEKALEFKAKVDAEIPALIASVIDFEGVVRAEKFEEFFDNSEFLKAYFKKEDLATIEGLLEEDKGSDLAVALQDAQDLMDGITGAGTVEINQVFAELGTMELPTNIDECFPFAEKLSKLRLLRKENNALDAVLSPVILQVEKVFEQHGLKVLNVKINDDFDESLMVQEGELIPDPTIAAGVTKVGVVISSPVVLLTEGTVPSVDFKGKVTVFKGTGVVAVVFTSPGGQEIFSLASKEIQNELSQLDKSTPEKTLKKKMISLMKADPSNNIKALKLYYNKEAKGKQRKGLDSKELAKLDYILSDDVKPEDHQYTTPAFNAFVDMAVGKYLQTIDNTNTVDFTSEELAFLKHYFKYEKASIVQAMENTMEALRKSGLNKEALKRAEDYMRLYVQTSPNNSYMAQRLFFDYKKVVAEVKEFHPILAFFKAVKESMSQYNVMDFKVTETPKKWKPYYYKVETIYDETKPDGFDEIEITSPVVLGKDKKIKYYGIATRTVKGVSTTGSLPTVDKTGSSIVNKNKDPELLKQAIQEGSILGYMWMDRYFETNGVAPKSVKDFYDLKMIAANSGPGDNSVTFKLKRGDVTEVTNTTEPRVRSNDAVLRSNNFEDILYIEATVTKNNQSTSFLYAIMPLKSTLGNFQDAKVYANMNAHPMSTELDSLKDLVDPKDGLDITNIMKMNYSSHITKGQFNTRLKPSATENSKDTPEVKWEKFVPLKDLFAAQSAMDKPNVKFHEEVFVLTKPIPGTGMVAGDAVLFASTDSTDPKFILADEVKKIEAGNVTNLDKRILIVPINTRRWDLFEMIDFFDQNNLGTADSKFLIGEGQSTRFYKTLQEILNASDKYVSNEVKTLIGKIFSHTTKAEGALWKNINNKPIADGHDLLRQLSLWSKNSPEEMETMKALWYLMSDTKGTFNIGLDTKTLGYTEGIWSSVSIVTGTNKNRDTPGIGLGTVETKNKLISVYDFVRTDLNFIGSPSLFIHRNAFIDIFNAAQEIASKGKKKAEKAEKSEQLLTFIYGAKNDSGKRSVGGKLRENYYSNVASDIMSDVQHDIDSTKKYKDELVLILQKGLKAVEETPIVLATAQKNIRKKLNEVEITLTKLQQKMDELNAGVNIEQLKANLELASTNLNKFLADFHADPNNTQSNDMDRLTALSQLLKDGTELSEDQFDDKDDLLGNLAIHYGVEILNLVDEVEVIGRKIKCFS